MSGTITARILGSGAASAFYTPSGDAPLGSQWRALGFNHIASGLTERGSVAEIFLIATTGGASMAGSETGKSIWTTFSSATQTTAGVTDGGLQDASDATTRICFLGRADVFGTRINFAGTTAVRGIRVKTSDGSSGYRIQRSKDSGASWQTVGIVFHTVGVAPGTTEEMMFAPSVLPSTPDINAARGWRMQSLETGAHRRIAEFICAKTTGGTTECTLGAPLFNLQRGAASAVSLYSAFDGNVGTYHAISEAFLTIPQHLGYVFTSAVAIKQIRIQAPSSGTIFPPPDFALQYSSDLQVWTTATVINGASWSVSEIKSYNVT